jgi:hypothetical protein
MTFTKRSVGRLEPPFEHLRCKRWEKPPFEHLRCKRWEKRRLRFLLSFYISNETDKTQNRGKTATVILFEERKNQ